ncbi:MAG: carbohydrate kinase family protein [Methanosphaera sp.]|nr:carbohydrate kinase family protein [Methanosphaera sp.]
MTYDVIGWGALNVDRLCSVDEFAPSDGETFINSETKTPGGSAANTIIGMAKLGLKTAYIGKVGSDSNGKILLDYLEDNNVDTKGVIRSDGESGEVIGFVDKTGDRKLYVTPKDNDYISIDEIDPDYISNTNIIHLTSFVGYGDDSTSIETQFDVIKDLPVNIKVAFDPGMLYVNRGDEFMDRLVDLTDILLINETELLMMTHVNDIHEAIDKISSRVEILVVKQSTNGSLVIKDNMLNKIEIFEVDAVDTTGAGDAYNAGFLYGLVKGYPIDEAGIIGSYIAAQSTTMKGATEAIPTIDSIDINKIIQSIKN